MTQAGASSDAPESRLGRLRAAVQPPCCALRVSPGLAPAVMAMVLQVKSCSNGTLRQEGWQPVDVRAALAALNKSGKSNWSSSRSSSRSSSSSSRRRLLPLLPLMTAWKEATAAAAMLTQQLHQQDQQSLTVAYKTATTRWTQMRTQQQEMQQQPMQQQEQQSFCPLTTGATPSLYMA